MGEHDLTAAPAADAFMASSMGIAPSGEMAIVAVHGAWADGSSWSAVIDRLQADGYTVTAPQFPESSLAGGVARLREVLD